MNDHHTQATLLHLLLVAASALALAACGTTAVKSDGSRMTRADMDRAEDVVEMSAATTMYRNSMNRQALWNVALGKHAANLAAGAVVTDAVSSSGAAGLGDLNAAVAGIEIARRVAGSGGGGFSAALIGVNLVTGLVQSEADQRRRELRTMSLPYLAVTFVETPQSGQEAQIAIQRVSDRIEALRERLDRISGCHGAVWRGNAVRNFERYRWVACTGDSARSANGGGRSVVSVQPPKTALTPAAKPGDVAGTIEYQFNGFLGSPLDATESERTNPRFARYGAAAAVELYKAMKGELPDDAWIMFSGPSTGSGRSSLYIGRGQTPLTEYVL